MVGRRRLYFSCCLQAKRWGALRRAVVFAASVVFAFSVAAAETPDRKLREVEKALEAGKERQGRLEQEVEALGGELEGLRVDSVAAARAAQEHEAALSGLEDELARLGVAERDKSRALQGRAAQQVELLMALQRLALTPPAAVLFQPGAPVDAARSALLLGAAVPRIEEAARALQRELGQLAALRDEIEKNRGELVRRRRLLEEEQARLAGLIARKAALQARAAKGVETAGQRLQLLSAQAADLRDLIERLEAERKRREAEERLRAEAAERREAELLARARAQPPRPGEAPAEASRAERPARVAAAPPRVEPGKPGEGGAPGERGAALVEPVSGRLLRKWNEADEAGLPSKGLSFETRPGAQVVAPFGGRVEFAGPFRGYGRILIIEHAGGYHSLLAGLDRIDAEVGQLLVAGEPVGVMKPGEARPILYFELRRNGQPVNPLPWLAARDEKVSG
jgi:septal ring factor EnvC (AmiA/AmiB activator)